MKNKDKKPKHELFQALPETAPDGLQQVLMTIPALLRKDFAFAEEGSEDNIVKLA